MSQQLEQISIQSPLTGMMIRSISTELRGQQIISHLEIMLIKAEMDNEGNIISGDFKINNHAQVFIKNKHLANLLYADVKPDMDFREYYLMGSNEIHATSGITRYTARLDINGSTFIFDNSKATKQPKPKIVKQSRTGARLPSNAEMLKVIGR